MKEAMLIMFTLWSPVDRQDATLRGNMVIVADYDSYRECMGVMSQIENDIRHGSSLLERYGVEPFPKPVAFSCVFTDPRTFRKLPVRR